jgi:hypothetical protein
MHYQLVVKLSIGRGGGDIQYHFKERHYQCQHRLGAPAGKTTAAPNGGPLVRRRRLIYHTPFIKCQIL